MTAAEPFQVLPPLTDGEYQALHDDIEAHGVRVPVLVDQHGRFLDGHHRAQIADKLKIEYPVKVVEVSDDDHARQIARSLNMARRQLSRKQKRELIAAEVEADPSRSDRAIGRLLGVDHKTVGSVRRELRGGEIPQAQDDDDDVPTLPQLGDRLYAEVVSRLDGADDDERRQWLIAVQIADAIADWTRSDRATVVHWPDVATGAYRNITNRQVWSLVNVLLTPMAKLALAECDDFRAERRAPDWKLPGETLARLHLAVWNDDLCDDTRRTMFAAMEAQFLLALADADALTTEVPA